MESFNICKNLHRYGVGFSLLHSLIEKAPSFVTREGASVVRQS
jgi:hypothetical protein